MQFSLQFCDVILYLGMKWHRKHLVASWKLGSWKKQHDRQTFSGLRCNCEAIKVGSNQGCNCLRGKMIWRHLPYNDRMNQKRNMHHLWKELFALHKREIVQKLCFMKLHVLFSKVNKTGPQPWVKWSPHGHLISFCKWPFTIVLAAQSFEKEVTKMAWVQKSCFWINSANKSSGEVL